MENAHYEKINTKFLQARNLGTRNKFPGPSVQKLVIEQSASKDYLTPSEVTKSDSCISSD